MEAELITTDLSIPEAKKEGLKQRRANAQAIKRKAEKSATTELIRIKAELDDLKARMIIPVTEGTEVSATPKPVIASEEIVWFTEVDINEKGKVASDFPAYYFDTKELKEDIRTLEEQIDDGIFQGKKKKEAAKKLSTMKDKYEKIENGRPKLSGPTKDKIVRAAKELGSRISDSMFSYDSHWKQTADAHEVAERMVNPCIEIKDEHVASFAKQRGFRIENGKISQNDASIIFKVMSKLIGEPSDTDRLRPIRQHGNVI